MNLVNMQLGDSRFWQHLKVLRLKSGEHIIIADFPGHGWELRLSAAPDFRNLTLSAMVVREITSVCKHDITLCLGISAAERFELGIRQTTELGVKRIIPFFSERVIVRISNDELRKKTLRWQRIAQAAAEQSGQLTITELAIPVAFADLPAMLSGYDLLIVFWEEARKETGVAQTQPFLLQFQKHLSETLRLRKTPKIALIVGAEGGLSDAEVKQLIDVGANVATLGDTILRTETAATVAVALVSQALDAYGS
jgi:16S rRNA (uracil1498-N3)-methyltransferase